MNITGSTNTCIITTNTPFYQSGNTENDSSTSVITITNENGLDLTNCFGVTSTISTVTESGISTGTTTNGGTTVQSSGTTTTPIGFNTSSSIDACQNILIIDPVTAVATEVECLYTGVTYLSTGLEADDGLILVTYSDGNTSLNVHPDCCASLDSSYVSEIGSEHYYVCRYRDFYDNTNCDNYTINGTVTLDADDYVIFTESSGGTTTIVPSIQCCSRYDLDSKVTTDGIQCTEKVIPVCAEYIIEADIPEIGDAEFTVLATGTITTVVPTIECCTIAGLFYREVEGGYSCYNTINPPTVSITLTDLCCEELGTIDPTPTTDCVGYTITIAYGFGYVEYLDCNNVDIRRVGYDGRYGNKSIQICAIKDSLNVVEVSGPSGYVITEGLCSSQYIPF